MKREYDFSDGVRGKYADRFARMKLKRAGEPSQEKGDGQPRVIPKKFGDRKENDR